MPSIVDAYVTILPETSRIAPKIKEAIREAERAAPKVTVDVDADTAGARAEIDSLQDHRVTVKVDVDRSELDRALSGFGGGGGGGITGFGGGSGGGIGGPLLKVNAGLVGIGLLPAAAAALADVAAAIQQVSGAALVAPGALAGMMASFGTVALGVSGMGDALGALTQAADGTEGSVLKANEALAALPTNSAEAVKVIFGLKGTFEALKDVAGNNLFEGFGGGLKGLVAESLPEVTRGIDGISRGLNSNLMQAMSSLSSDSSQGFLDRILGNTAEAQARLTAAIDPFVHAMGTLTAAGTDTLPRLADALGDVATRFDSFITTADSDGRLDRWISEGLDGFTNLGNILLNVGKAFGGITEAADGPGLLSTLETLTERMQLFFNSADGQDKLKQFFADGRVLMGQFNDVAVELGPTLREAFSVGLSAAQVWLPTIREVLDIINRIPGGANLVVSAFLAWRTMSGVTSLVGALNTVGTALGGLPGKADTAAKGINLALASIVVPAIGEMLNNEIDKFLQQNFPGLDRLNHTNTPDQLGARLREWWDRGNHPAPGPSPLPQFGGQPSSAPTVGGIPIPGLLAPNAAGPQTTAAAPPLSRSALDRIHGTDGSMPALAPAVEAAVPSVSVPAVTDYVAPTITQPSSGSGTGLPRNIIVTPQNIQEAINAATRVSGNPYGYGGVGPGSMSESGAGLYDCSGFMSDLFAILTGKPYTGNERYFTTESDFTSLGFVEGFDPNSPFNIGVHNGGGGKNSHMAGTLAGVNVESGSNGTLFGGLAAGADDPQFEKQYHLPSSYDTTLNSWYAGGSPALSGATSAILGSKANPMYVDYTTGSAFSKDSGGQQLGQDLVTGVMELFGIDGSVFPNFMDTGTFKTAKSLLSFLTQPMGGAEGAGGGEGTGSFLDNFLGGGGGNALSGVLNAASGIRPEAFGPLKVGGQDRVPAGPVHGAGGQPGPDAPGAGDYRIQQTFNGPVGSPHEAFKAARDANIPRMRQGMRPLPK